MIFPPSFRTPRNGDLESGNNRITRFWIAGSRAALAPRNDILQGWRA